jgi:hypothetical protein
LKWYSQFFTTSTSFDNEKVPMRHSSVHDLQRNAIRDTASRCRTANPRRFGSVWCGTDQTALPELLKQLAFACKDADSSC